MVKRPRRVSEIMVKQIFLSDAVGEEILDEEINSLVGGQFSASQIELAKKNSLINRKKTCHQETSIQRVDMWQKWMDNDLK